MTMRFCSECRFRMPRFNRRLDECARDLMLGLEPEPHPVLGQRGQWLCIERRLSPVDLCGAAGYQFEAKS